MKLQTTYITQKLKHLSKKQSKFIPKLNFKKYTLLKKITIFIVGVVIGSLLTTKYAVAKYSNKIDEISSSYLIINQECSQTNEKMKSELSSLQNLINDCENRAPEVIYKTEYKTRELSAEEYEAWCRENTIGLVKTKNKDGKLWCLPQMTAKVCPVCLPSQY